MTREEKVSMVEGICNREPCSSECRFKDICDNTPYLLGDWPDVALDQCLRRIGIDPETGEKIADQEEVKEATGMTREERVSMVEDICNRGHCGGECVIEDICGETFSVIRDWPDNILDRALRAARIDPETGEKITAVTDTEEPCPVPEAPTCDELIEPEPPVEEPTQDVVNHPRHYELPNGLECIDAMVATLGRETVMAFCKANAFKYLWRHERKNGAEDVEKARWYLNKWHELREDGETA